jgi:hypothetical protein
MDKVILIFNGSRALHHKILKNCLFSLHHKDQKMREEKVDKGEEEVNTVTRIIKGAEESKNLALTLMKTLKITTIKKDKEGGVGSLLKRKDKS